MESISSGRSCGDEPPSSVTGVEVSKPGSQGWGWFQFTIPRGGLEVARPLVAAVGEWREQSHGLGWYQGWAKLGTRGSSVQWLPANAGPERVGEVHVMIVQGDCDALGWDWLAATARRVFGLGGHFSRADGYYDDRARRASADLVVAAGRAGRYVSHVRQENIRFEGTCAQDGPTGVYVGAPKSPRRLRVYDKDHERRRAGEQVPDGTYGYRWELQCRDEWADSLVRTVLLAPADERGRAFAAAVAGLIDFRDREDGGPHGDRAPRLAWWQELVGDVERARLAVAEAADSLMRRAKWFRKQVAPTLALILRACEGDLAWVLSVAQDGERRLRPEQWLLLRPELRPVAAIG